MYRLDDCCFLLEVILACDDHVWKARDLSKLVLFLEVCHWLVRSNTCHEYTNYCRKTDLPKKRCSGVFAKFVGYIHSFFIEIYSKSKI